MKISSAFGWAVLLLTPGLLENGFGQVTITEPSVAELASAVGIRPCCADARFPAPVYTRMVATITDADGATQEREVAPANASNYWRLRVFLFEDIQSRRPQRLIFNIAESGSVAGNAFVDFPSGSVIARVTTGTKGSFHYEAAVPSGNGPKDMFTVSIRLETSPNPFPHPLWESTINQPVFSPRDKKHR